MAVYPPDAPLPRFKIVKIQAMQADHVHFQVVAMLANFDDLDEWFKVNKNETFYGESVFATSAVPTPVFGSLSFINGISDALPRLRARSEAFGKWVSLDFTDIIINGFKAYYEVSPPLHFCDVYVPNPSDLPVGVWTDLQFKQGNGTKASGLAIIAVPLVLLFLLILFLGLSGGRKHGRG